MPKRFFQFDPHKTPDRPRQTTIHRGLTSGMILIVLATIFIVGMPTIGMIWWQLEHQVQLRVQAVQSSTQALYLAEQRNILQLVQLISQRPTLCTLLQKSDDPNLVAYLDILRQNTTADTLAVVTSAGRIITSGNLQLPPEAFLERSSLPYVDFIALDVPPGLGIFAVGEVTSEAGCEKGLAGRVIAFRLLDQNFMHDLAGDTGLEQSLIIGGHRVATSFRNVADLPLNPDASYQVLQTGEACCTTGASGSETYYVGLAPLLNGQGDIVALSEVALPANNIRSSTFKTMALFVGLGLLVALGSAGFAWQLTGRITGPLQKLTDAAERMGAGDLETPIPVDSGWRAIDRLANQLEDSRRNLTQIQQIARRELRHIVHILAAAREGILTLDESDMITWVNTDACRLLGYERHHMLRRHYKQIFPPAPGEMTSLENLLNPAPGQPPPDRLTILNAQGSFITLAVSQTLLESDSRDGAHQQKERVLILREVGEEQALNHLRAEFLANVAHEFRTPLSAISASTELLVDEGGEMDSDELAYLARTINLSVVHLQALVNNMLESAIIEAGVFRLHRRPFALRKILQEVAGMMLPLLERRRQQLDIVGPDDEPVQLWGDPDRLKQALVNLVENASKFSPSGTSITLSVVRDLEMLTFSVSDCGPGLPAERFESLFSRFFIGRHSGSAQYGIGLGLPIVKAIAEAHGGVVGAANLPGGGASVWFTIPLRQAPEKEEQ